MRKANGIPAAALKAPEASRGRAGIRVGMLEMAIEDPNPRPEVDRQGVCQRF